MSENDDTAGFPPITGLYVPGHRADRFDRALGSGADLVILDLEDAVPADRKAEAREAILAVLTGRSGGDAETPVADIQGAGFPSSATLERATQAGEPAASTAQVPTAQVPTARTPAAQVSESRSPIIQVRVNAGPLLADDVAALEAVLGASTSPPVEIRLPKVESAADVSRLMRLLDARHGVGDVPVTAIIETALGVERALEIASHVAVTRLALGESDLASDLGSRHPDVIGYARNRVLFAAKAAALGAPMMSAYPDIRDTAGLRADTVDGAARGWLGRVAIHPSQLPVIASAFRPEPAEVVWAEQVLDAMRGGGVTTLESGEMVDPAMIGRARSILARRNATAAVS